MLVPRTYSQHVMTSIGFFITRRYTCLIEKQKKAAMDRLRHENAGYETAKTNMISSSDQLYNLRLNSMVLIEHGWRLVNEFRNQPEDLKLQVNKIQVDYANYEQALNHIKHQSSGLKLGTFTASSIVSLLTTFGLGFPGVILTAGIGGSAISLAGVASLGGLVALSSPVGWIASSVGGVLLAGHQNKKVAEEATQTAIQIHATTEKINVVYHEIGHLRYETRDTNEGLQLMQRTIMPWPRDYQSLTTDQQYRLGSIVNNLQSAIKLLNQTVGDAAESNEVVTKDQDSKSINNTKRGTLDQLNQEGGVIVSGDENYQFKRFNVFGEPTIGASVRFRAHQNPHGTSTATEIHVL